MSVPQSTPLTVCVIACKEEAELGRCLDSVAWADEIVAVVDAKSTDRTEEIARLRATRVEVRPYEGDIEQKRYCTSLAKNDWVLIIDPDEVMRPELAESLRSALEAGGEVAGYELDRMTYHLGRWIKHGDFYPDWKLRVFKTSKARWIGDNPHGRVVVDGSVRRLAGVLEHYSYDGLADQLDRIRFFAAESAASMRAAGRRSRLRDLALRPPARFARAYLLKAGFLDGVPGFVIAAATAFHVFLKYALLWERERHGAGGGPASLP